jgi:heme-degrading monooxygenase HmoA
MEQVKLQRSFQKWSLHRPASLILEAAVLDVRAGETDEFESSFQKAEPILISARGYLSHELSRCFEKSSRYILLVRWEHLEDHTEGFRRSAEYAEWKRILHHFYDPFPTVEHFTPMVPAGK